MAVNQINQPMVHGCTKNNHASSTGGLCYLCNSPIRMSDSLLCSHCSQDLPLNNNACPVCANPGENGYICASCLQTQAPSIQKIYCAFRYEYPVSQLIRSMKFSSRLDVIAFLGRRMAKLAILEKVSLPDCFIPVPLHFSRLKERGYNQSLELARIVANETGGLVDHAICRRTQNTATQTGLNARQRKRNIKGVFDINSRTVSRYRHVVIVDDVVTTGSTVYELARILRKAGIAQVDVWACARATFTQGNSD